MRRTAGAVVVLVVGLVLAGQGEGWALPVAMVAAWLLAVSRVSMSGLPAGGRVLGWVRAGLARGEGRGRR